MNVPKEILTQHVAVLGKTGSGKTSTAKLAIEQVVADGARVCVLDPIKSDWWGLTSSRDGTRPGLPFHILGGPHGHVPLHSSAGKAIAEIVGSGALPLSIIDMADFEPGGLQRFFVPFAETLLKRMRGVLYLVIEEAHEFAPKERAGFDHENLAIHFAKKLATAGRSKGIRMVLATQRTQALHNAMLGSCDTLIVHRMTAPADQEPVIKWLKANTSKEVLEQVANSLASLTTGHGWVCSGEAKIFQAMHFKRIATYDNTATPTGDVQTRDVKTAPVDTERLRAIIGDAVEKAKADDPKVLRAKVAELERELNLAKKLQAPQSAPTIKEVQVLKGSQIQRLQSLISKAEVVSAKLLNCGGDLAKHVDGLMEAIRSTAQGRVPTRAHTSIRVPTRMHTPPTPIPAGVNLMDPTADLHTRGLTNVTQRILDALAELSVLGVDQPERVQVAFLAGYSNLTSKGFVNAISSLRTSGLIDYPGQGTVTLTPTGRHEANFPSRPRSSDELQARVLHLLGGVHGRVLQPLLEVYPDPIPRQELAAKAGYTNLTSKGFVNALSRLRSLGFIDYPNQGMAVAKSVLFIGGG